MHTIRGNLNIFPIAFRHVHFAIDAELVDAGLHLLNKTTVPLLMQYLCDDRGANENSARLVRPDYAEKCENWRQPTNAERKPNAITKAIPSFKFRHSRYSGRPGAGGLSTPKAPKCQSSLGLQPRHYIHAHLLQHRARKRCLALGAHVLRIGEWPWDWHVVFMGAGLAVAPQS